MDTLLYFVGNSEYWGQTIEELQQITDKPSYGNVWKRSMQLYCVQTEHGVNLHTKPMDLNLSVGEQIHTKSFQLHATAS